MRKKVTLIASLGAALEYYDFVIYGMMAGYLSHKFFTFPNPTLAIVYTFFIFAIGYIARPFGGILFGLIADRTGRKFPFANIMCIMAIATMSIGLLPDYHTIGGTATIAILALRILQGLSYGAELPGAMTIVGEYNPRTLRALHSGFIISSTGLGALSASFILFILTSIVSNQEILDFYWRIPFLIGGLLALISFYIRKNISETEEFLLAQKTNQLVSYNKILIKVIKQYPQQILFGITFSFLPITLIIVNLYFPTFFTTILSLNAKDVYLAITISLIWCTFCAPFCGLLSDKLGRNKFFNFVFILFILYCNSFFYFMHDISLYKLIVFLMLYQTFIAATMTNYFPTLIELFPTEIRCTAIAICYNIAFAIAAFIPALLTFALKTYTTFTILCVFFVIIAVMSFIANIFLVKINKLKTPQFICKTKLKFQ